MKHKNMKQQATQVTTLAASAAPYTVFAEINAHSEMSAHPK